MAGSRAPVKRGARGRPAVHERARIELADRLCARRQEIEQAVMTRVYAVAEPNEVDPSYADGLQAAVSTAIAYGIEIVERGERAPSPPPPLLAQARLAARNSVPLETVLRRYCAGQTLLIDFAIEEAERGESFEVGALRSMLRSQAALTDRLLEAVGEEYRREERIHTRTMESRHAERIERLLAGELLDLSSIPYDFGAHHVAAVALGAHAPESLRRLAEILDRRLLMVRRDEDVIWVWLGGRQPFDLKGLAEILAAAWPSEEPLALGEPGQGLDGWRLSHRQARAALQVAVRSSKPVVHYADVALLASILQDDLLAASLRKLCLKPLEGSRDDGETFRNTLRAYFAARCNVSSAAAELGVSRQAVARRLRAIEDRLGTPLAACGLELEAALRLDELRRQPASG